MGPSHRRYADRVMFGRVIVLQSHTTHQLYRSFWNFFDPFLRQWNHHHQWIFDQQRYHHNFNPRDSDWEFYKHTSGYHYYYRILSRYRPRSIEWLRKSQWISPCCVCFAYCGTYKSNQRKLHIRELRKHYYIFELSWIRVRHSYHRLQILGSDIQQW